jgi:hypothetical protein
MTSYAVGHRHNRTQELDNFQADTPLEAAQLYLDACDAEHIFDDMQVWVVENLFEAGQREQFFDVGWPGPKAVEHNRHVHPPYPPRRPASRTRPCLLSLAHVRHVQAELPQRRPSKLRGHRVQGEGAAQAGVPVN